MQGWKYLQTALKQEP